VCTPILRHWWWPGRSAHEQGARSKDTLPLPLSCSMTGVKPVVLCPFPPGGVAAMGMQVSHPTGSSLFAPCPRLPPLFYEQPCFPRAGFFFFLKKTKQKTCCWMVLGPWHSWGGWKVLRLALKPDPLIYDCLPNSPACFSDCFSVCKTTQELPVTQLARHVDLFHLVITDN
jgi:hypothetical protein